MPHVPKFCSAELLWNSNSSVTDLHGMNSSECFAPGLSKSNGSKIAPAQVWHSLAVLHDYCAGHHMSSFDDVEADNVRLRAENARMRSQLVRVDRHGKSAAEHMAHRPLADKGMSSFRVPLPAKPAESISKDDRPHSLEKLGFSEYDMSAQDEDYSVSGCSSDGCNQRCSFVSTDESTSDWLKNWRRFLEALVRPRARLARQTAHRMHDLWRDCLQQARSNTHNDAISTARSVRARLSCRTDVSDSPTRKFSPTRKILSWVAAGSNGSRSNMGFSERLGKRCRVRTIHPFSSHRLAWVLASYTVLLHDAMYCPINVFFDTRGEGSQFAKYALRFGAAFWLLDIFATCLTGCFTRGVLEMRLQYIVRAYAKSWLAFDLSLVVMEWLLVIIELYSESLSWSAFRFVRLAKLLRFLRLRGVVTMMCDTLGFHSKNTLLSIKLIKTTLAYALYFHLLACVWYSIGKANGNRWTRDCASQTNMQCYFSAYHWALTQVHGATNADYNSTVEWAFSVVSLFCGLILFAFFLGQTADGAAQLSNVNKLELKLRCIRFTESRKLSPMLSHRLLTYIETCYSSSVGLGQRIRQDNDIVQKLPMPLQVDILVETRKPLLLRGSVFENLGCLSPHIVTRLCTEAVSAPIYSVWETVFSNGDSCTHWRTVDDGCFVYVSPNQMWSDFATAFNKLKEANSGNLESSAEAFTFKAMEAVSRGTLDTMDRLDARENILSQSKKGCAKAIPLGYHISEMVLWTDWEHKGDMIATTDGALLQLSLTAFFDALRGRTDACCLVAIYARQYVKLLNSRFGELTDLVQLSPNEENSDDDTNSEDEHSVAQHHIFLSHYKIEAGTEATLLQKDLQMLLSEYDTASVFLDSEDLTDLRTLKNHVVNSLNVVLLLTPGVLLRPWCLVEIVTAMNHNVHIVPVEIQKPGLKFTYPDDAFYERLRNGTSLPANDVQLLKNEGITLEAVVNAIKCVFTQIAVPFSPHKSKNVREAELADIVERCVGDTPHVIGSKSLDSPIPVGRRNRSLRTPEALKRASVISRGSGSR